MASSFITKYTPNSYRLVLVSIVLIILINGFNAEKILLDNGFGWDGRVFGNLTLNVLGHIQRHLIEPYRFQRIAIPFCTNIVFRIFHFDLSDANVLRAYLCINFACISIGMFYYFKIANLLQLSKNVELIGFASLFFCFPVLKLAMFYPVLMDISAYIIGIILVYYYLKQNTLISFLLILIGSFVYPTFILYSILFMFNQTPILNNNNTSISTNKWIAISENKNILPLTIKFLFPLLLIVLFFVLFYETNFNLIIQSFQTNLIKSIMVWASLLVGLFYIIFLSTYNQVFFSLKDIYAAINKKSVFVTLTIFLIIKSTIFLLSSNVASVLTFQGYLLNVCKQVVQEPFNFLVAHTYYFGLIILMQLFVIKNFKIVVANYGFGMLFFITIVFFFSVGNESRQLINYYPFIVLITLITLNKYYTISSAFTIGFAFLNILMSHFWYTINKGITTAKEFLVPEATQRYFMFHGPWVSHYSYVIHLLICLTLLLLVYIVFTKTKLIVKKPNSI